jgi:hypothetical protein
MVKDSHAGEQHPEEWQRDLNPDPQAGQNRGFARERIDEAATAYEVKDAHRKLSELSDDELRRIPILPAGERLQQGAVYINLREQQCREFKARGDQEAGPDDLIVPKSEVDYVIWNRLIGVDTPARLDEPDEA